MAEKIPVEDIHSQFEAFEACFYTLPAQFMAPSEGGLLCLDIRHQKTVEESLQQPELLQQVQLMDQEREFEEWKSIAHELPTAYSPKYESLGGLRQGMQYFTTIGSGLATPPCYLGTVELAPLQMFHFIWAFPTKKAASECFRESQWDDSTPELEMILFPEAEQALLEEFDGITKFIKVTQNRPNNRMPAQFRSFAIVGVVGFYATKIFATAFVPRTSSIQEIVVALGTKVLNHVLATASDDSSCSSFNRVQDPSLCSWCGRQGDAITLHRCSFCRKAYYCNQECQRSHWKMKGPFGHKALCVKRDETASLSIGSHVLVHGLSKSSKHINGKKGIVLSDTLEDDTREVVLIDNLSTDKLNRILQNPSDLSWVEGDLKQNIKGENLRASKLAIMPTVNFEDESWEAGSASRSGGIAD